MIWLFYSGMNRIITLRRFFLIDILIYNLGYL